MRENAEVKRLEAAHRHNMAWKKWGPYLSERQWGTVREDYSEDGNAWDYFRHDQARSRAYHWGEDGLAGVSDEKQFLCFALALWNGRDPILKERLFGLTNSEGRQEGRRKALLIVGQGQILHKLNCTLGKELWRRYQGSVFQDVPVPGRLSAALLEWRNLKAAGS